MVHSNGILGSVKKIFRRNTFYRNVAILSGGTVMAQLINLLSSPIVTRIYTPEDLGNLSVYISMASILGIVACLRYESAIPLPLDDESGIHLLILSILIPLPLAGILWGLIFFFNDQIVELINAPALKSYLWLLPFSVICIGIYQALTFWAIRMHAYGRVAQTKFSQSFGTALTQIGLGLLNLRQAGLLIADVFGRSCGISTLAVLTWQQGKENIRTISLRGIIETANRYRRFPLISSSANLLNGLNLYLPPLITTSFYGTQVAGQMMLSQIVLGIPSVLLASSISQAYLGESAKVMKNAPHEQMSLFKKTLFRLAIVGIPVYVLIAFFTPWTFVFIFGKEWNDAALYLQVLTPMFILQFIGSPLSAIQDVLQRQDLQLVAQLIRVALLFGAAYIAKLNYLTPVYWLLFMSISMAIAYIVSIYISYITIKEDSKIDS